MPVPGVLGALVLEAAAWVIDSRDPERHSGDAAFLTSLMSDPVIARSAFAGSDRKRLLRLDKVLGDPEAVEWGRLGDAAGDAYTTWRLAAGLTSPYSLSDTRCKRSRIGGRAKAMVVTRSRLHVVKYFAAISAHVAKNDYRDVRAPVALSCPAQ